MSTNKTKDAGNELAQHAQPTGQPDSQLDDLVINDLGELITALAACEDRTDKATLMRLVKAVPDDKLDLLATQLELTAKYAEEMRLTEKALTN